MDTPIVPPLRRCTKCGKEYLATTEYFVSDKRHNSGIGAICRICKRKQDAEYRASHPGLRQRYYQEHREHERETNRQYCEIHRQEIAIRTKAYRKTKAFKQSKKKHRQKPEVRTLDNIRGKVRFHAVRAKTVHLPGTITRHQWQSALDYFNGCCAVCERPLRNLFNDVVPALDHWIPISKGGGSTADNIIPLCHGINGCNNSKKDNMPETWLVRRYGKRKATKILKRINDYFASLEDE